MKDERDGQTRTSFYIAYYISFQFYIKYYIITLRIQALSESHDLLEDRHTELHHTKPYPTAFPYLYRSCMCDICEILTFSNFQMLVWIKSNLFTCLISIIMWEEQKSDPLASAARDHFVCSSPFCLLFPHYDVILCIYN